MKAALAVTAAAKPAGDDHAGHHGHQSRLGRQFDDCISPTNGTGAGFFPKASTGKLSVIDSGTRLDNGAVVQNAMRTATSGNIDFRVAWTAPATPGAWTSRPGATQ